MVWSIIKPYFEGGGAYNNMRAAHTLEFYRLTYLPLKGYGIGHTHKILGPSPKIPIKF
jgi:hypothetical protein